MDHVHADGAERLHDVGRFLRTLRQLPAAANLWHRAQDGEAEFLLDLVRVAEPAVEPVEQDREAQRRDEAAQYA